MPEPISPQPKTPTFLICISVLYARFVSVIPRAAREPYRQKNCRPEPFALEILLGYRDPSPANPRVRDFGKARDSGTQASTADSPQSSQSPARRRCTLSPGRTLLCAGVAHKAE